VSPFPFSIWQGKCAACALRPRGRFLLLVCLGAEVLRPRAACSRLSCADRLLRSQAANRHASTPARMVPARPKPRPCRHAASPIGRLKAIRWPSSVTKQIDWPATSANDTDSFPVDLTMADAFPRPCRFC
jgi:hypothetical protein